MPPQQPCVVRRESIGRRCVPVALALAATTLAAAGQATLSRGSRAAVVAIHDSRLLTVCPILGKTVVASDVLSSDMKAEASVSYPPDGSLSIGVRSDDRMFRVSLPAAGSITADTAPRSSAPEARDLERLARDLDVQARVEQRFRSLKTFTVVDSPADADVVFFVESQYVPMAASSTQLPPGAPPQRTGEDAASRINRIFSDTESEWRRRMWLDRNDPNAPAGPGSARPGTGPSPSARGSVLTLAAIGGDRLPNWRQSAIAIVVPAATYLRHAGNGAALAASRIWQGLSGMGGSAPPSRAQDAGPTGVRSASPEELVDRFHGRGAQMTADLPVCAATTGTIRDIDDRPEQATGGASLGAPAGPPAVDPPPVAAASAARFRTNITLVTVPVTVTDAEGRRLADLPASAFRVFEDGVEQRVDRVEAGSGPTHVALLVDTSAGMRSVIERIRTAARSLANALRPADAAMVVSFDSRVQVRSEFTSDREATERAIGQLRQRGQTRLYDALTLTVVDRLSLADRRTAVVLFTDGVDTGSQLTDAGGALAAVDTSNVGVYVVRYETGDAPGYLTWASKYGTGQRPLVELTETQSDQQARSEADRFLDRLARGSGGRVYLARPDADPREPIEQVSQDLSHQYVLAYYAANGALDGTYREIRVTVDRPGAAVRARTGYRAGARQADRPRDPARR